MTQRTKHPPGGGKALPSAKKRGYVPFLLLGGGALLALIVAILVLYKPGDQPSPATTPAQVTGKPRVALDKTQIDFGQVKLGKTVQATFRVSNVGDQPLKIVEEPLVEVQRGC